MQGHRERIVLATKYTNAAPGTGRAHYDRQAGKPAKPSDKDKH